ncbi:hypothetical protein [Streptomyces sp. NPDC003393]
MRRSTRHTLSAAVLAGLMTGTAAAAAVAAEATEAGPPPHTLRQARGPGDLPDPGDRPQPAPSPYAAVPDAAVPGTVLPGPSEDPLLLGPPSLAQIRPLLPPTPGQPQGDSGGYPLESGGHLPAPDPADPVRPNGTTGGTDPTGRTELNGGLVPNGSLDSTGTSDTPYDPSRPSAPLGPAGSADSTGSSDTAPSRGDSAQDASGGRDTGESDGHESSDTSSHDSASGDFGGSDSPTQHGVQAGAGGSFTGSLPPLIGGGALIASALGAAGHRMWRRRSTGC